MMKNRAVDRSSVHSFVPSALHQNLSVSNHHFTPNADTVRSTSGTRGSLNLFNGGLQNTFATG